VNQWSNSRLPLLRHHHAIYASDQGSSAAIQGAAAGICGARSAIGVQSTTTDNAVDLEVHSLAAPSAGEEQICHHAVATTSSGQEFDASAMATTSAREEPSGEIVATTTSSNSHQNDAPNTVDYVAASA
jgi:hypothetical protein